MSETNQEPVQQDENNFEYNENELQNDQNHEEDAENHENEINPYSLQEEESQNEANEANQEGFEKQYSNNDGQEIDNQQLEDNSIHSENHEDFGQGEEEGELELEGQQEIGREEEEHEIGDQQEFVQEAENNEEVQVLADEEKTIEELRNELEEAITQLDFVRAQSIQEEIDGLSTQNHSQFLDEYAQRFTEECNKIAQKHRKEKRHIQEEYLEKEIEERTRMSEGFQELKRNHIEQLQKLENELFNIYKERMKKPIAAYDELIERAKKTARRGDFSSAQDYQLQAKNAKEEEEGKREELFKKDYEARITALLDRQSQEISDFGVISNNSINKLLKIKDEQSENENERFKRAMNRKYRETCDKITHSRYNPNKPNEKAIDPKVKPSLLNRIEDAYNLALVKYGLQIEGNAKKPKMIAPNIRPESQMSVRMQSRVEMRETEKKKKEAETMSRVNSRMSSRAASRSGSKQPSPKSSPKSNYTNTNNSRRSPFSPSKF